MGASEDDEGLESYGAEIGEPAGPAGRVREWVLVQGDRTAIAVGISLAVFVLLLALNELGVVSFVNDDSVTRVASGMIAGTFSLVTLVVSVNQLILSQEFAAAGKARDQLEGVMGFRRDLEDSAKVPASPASPTRLLELLVETIHHRADDVEGAVAGDRDEAGDQVRRYVASVQESTERIDDTLEHATFGTFEAVSAAIDYDAAWQLYAARHVRGRYADSLSDDALEAFEELIDALKLFTVAREHFKTTYLQRELTRFSQLTIYTGVPAILSAITIGLLYADLGGASINLAYLPYVVSALIAVVVSPLALLVSYILRTATVTRRTASVGPMLPNKDPDEGPFDVSYGEQAE